MKIYDIVTEARSVGKGDYAGFVWDQPSGSRNISVTFPDGRTTTVTSQADAKRVADDWLTRSRNGSTAGPSTTQPDADRHRFNSKWSRVRSLIGPIGDIVLTAVMWREIEQTMRQLWNAKEDGQITQEQYERAVSSAFGAWVATASIGVLRLVIRGGSRLLRMFRAWNAATSLMAAAAGPLGALIGLVKFVLFEASSWVAAYFLANNETFQHAIAKIIFSRIGAIIFEQFEVGADALANIDSIVADRFNSDNDVDNQQAPEQQRRARSLIGLEPQDMARAEVNRAERAAAGSNGQQPATGNQTAAPPAAQPQGNDWMVAPSLR